MEFHVSRKARERYQFDQRLFSLTGNAVIANFYAARLFANKMNQKRDLVRYPEQAVKASHINAMGLIDEIAHLVIKKYREQRNPQVLQQAMAWLEDSLGKEDFNTILTQFSIDFPPMRVFLGETPVSEYLQAATEGRSNREIVLEELLLLWLSNQNPAFTEYQELYDDSRLTAETKYRQLTEQLYEFFKSQPQFGSQQLHLIDLLLSPARAHPYSLMDQLKYIREYWGDILGEYLYRLLSSLDFIREEEKLVFFGSGPVEFPDFRSLPTGETERFSLDKEWMPRLVLIAKNIYVWLDQLSKKYQQHLTHLDQIPDAEFQSLREMGITGLWLIGVWERSRASSIIKQLCGNPEALASAYSLYSYNIANDLGGQPAFDKLKNQAWRFGIRMASDMVPNHMGIDSPWVVDHPDWFISLDYSPYPAHSYNGQDLSDDPRVVIQIEDHYFDRTDASVVFKYYDRRNGQTRYIYHGNDGTNMPWNDTAQLNYLLTQVREAVIQLVVNVAKQFPIIRFDAAMTLAKRHFQRLWFPEPGSGGDIPTRSDHGMTKDQFDAMIPQEFWREVVDRVAVEAPDTLLLAEAFWLMEGYFVRTLGMHRVYNSAFMNLLRNEDNAKFRSILKNTLEFEPEILKRFVNFMNNPDERTAVDQFGKGDKYFGVCTMMATLPGLPMIGHGQIEGFTEKYGMEYRKAYWDEVPDTYLVERHQREIAPLLHRRHLFANVDYFLLYDFHTPSGSVDQDVYCYSNRDGDQKALVVFHNRYGNTSGWIRHSVPFAARVGGEQKVMTQHTLQDGLLISSQPNTFTLFRDQISNLQYIRANDVLINEGLYLELGAFRYHVFLDFQEVIDDEWGSYRRLCDFLNGMGVPSIAEAAKELMLQPVLQPFQDLISAETFTKLFDLHSVLEPKDQAAQADQILGDKLRTFLQGAAVYSGEKTVAEKLEKKIVNDLACVFSASQPPKILAKPGEASQKAYQIIQEVLESHESWRVLFTWCVTRQLGLFVETAHIPDASRSLFDDWRLRKAIYQSFLDAGISDRSAWKMVNLLDILVQHQDWFEESGHLPLLGLLENWLSQENIRNFLGVNRYMDVLWYNKEAFEDLLGGMFILVILQGGQDPAVDPLESILLALSIYQDLQKANDKSDYQVAKLIDSIEE